MTARFGSGRLYGAVAALCFHLAAQGVGASSADAYIAEANAYLGKGEEQAAIIQLKNALQADPSHIDARLMLGGVYLRKGDAAAAVKELGRARDLGAARERWLPAYARALT